MSREFKEKYMRKEQLFFRKNCPLGMMTKGD